MNEHPSSNPTNPITEQLEQTMPLADEQFQQTLENQLMEEWYQVTGKSKRKQPFRVNVPFTYIASLVAILLTGGIIIFQSLGTNLANQGASQNLPLATQVPTPKLATATPDLFHNPGEIALQLAPDTVAMALEIEETEDHLLVGDVISIRAVINRDQVMNIPEPVQSEVIALLDQYQVDELSVLLVKNAVIIRLQDDMEVFAVQVSPKVLTLQISQQESITLTWLINSGIAIQIEQVTMPDRSETPMGIAPNRIVFALQLANEDFIPLTIGDKVNISFVFLLDSHFDLKKKLLAKFGEGVIDLTRGTTTVRVVSDAIVIRTQKKIGIIAVQMTQDDAEMINWLTEMQIPYKIEKVE